MAFKFCVVVFISKYFFLSHDPPKNKIQNPTFQEEYSYIADWSYHSYSVAERIMYYQLYVKVKSAYEPCGSPGWSLSLFL